MTWTMANDRREPRVGDLWWDRDDRVTSRYVRIVEVADNSVVVRRGENGTGNRSRIRKVNLERRFYRLDRGLPAMNREESS